MWLNAAVAAEAHAPAVLVVEDDAAVRLLLGAVFHGSPYRLVEARDGAGALEAARRERPAVVLLDVGLPGDLDGFAVCRAIKADPELAGVAVVLLTARAEDAHRQAGREAGADAHLVKPFSPAALLELVALLAGQ